MSSLLLNNFSKKTRPKIKIEKSTFDIFLEVISFIGLIYIWFLVFKYYPSLPETIATHFNAAGKINDYGSKSTILLLPAIGTFVYLLLTLISNFPHTFNYLVEITKENAERQYKLAVQMIRFLKVDIIIIFGIITNSIIKSAISNKSDLGIWFVPLFLGITFIPMIFYIIQMVRAK